MLLTKLWKTFLTYVLKNSYRQSIPKRALSEHVIKIIFPTNQMFSLQKLVVVVLRQNYCTQKKTKLKGEKLHLNIIFIFCPQVSNFINKEDLPDILRIFIFLLEDTKSIKLAIIEICNASLQVEYCTFLGVFFADIYFWN